MLLSNFNRRRGQTVAEYAVILCGVLVVSLAAISVFGDKVSDMWATAAVVLPGAQGEDNGPIVAGTLIEHTGSNVAQDPITLDLTNILGNSGLPRLGLNLFGSNVTNAYYTASAQAQGQVLASLVLDF
jgi:Flp pilus assembly pilin Flp